MENGKAGPSLDLLTRLAKCYRTTADYLLGLTDDPDPVRAANREKEAALLAQLPGHEQTIVRCCYWCWRKETPENVNSRWKSSSACCCPSSPTSWRETP